MGLNITYKVKSKRIPKSIKQSGIRKSIKKESHIGTFWLSIKALAEVLIKGPYHVFYPEAGKLQKIAEADSENEMKAILTSPDHFKFTFMKIDPDGSFPIYPTIIVISDNPKSSKNDPAKTLASHLHVTADDINLVLADYFLRNKDAKLSEIFEYIEADNGRGNSGEVRVSDYSLNDNAFLNEIQEEVMLAALNTTEKDLYAAAVSLELGSQGMVPMNRDEPQNNALDRKLPKYSVASDGSVIPMGEPMSYGQLKSAYFRQIQEWFRPRNHAGYMWDLAWKKVAEDFMAERTDTNLDYNPYERAERKWLNRSQSLDKYSTRSRK